MRCVRAALLVCMCVFVCVCARAFVCMGVYAGVDYSVGRGEWLSGCVWGPEALPLDIHEIVNAVIIFKVCVINLKCHLNSCF